MWHTVIVIACTYAKNVSAVLLWSADFWFVAFEWEVTAALSKKKLYL
jgi:hypothetical protein